MEIITDNTLVPCKRGRLMGLPITADLQDLSENEGLSKAVLKKVATLFNLTPNEAIISGLARRAADGFLYVQVWDREEPIRTIAFRSEGFAGIVHLDLVYPEGGEYIYDADLFATLDEDLTTSFEMPHGWVTDRIWFVQGGNLEIDLPLKTYEWRRKLGRQVFGYIVDDNFTPNDPNR